MSGSIHRLFARHVWSKTGFTHWSAVGGRLTFDPSCLFCRIQQKSQSVLPWPQAARLLLLLVALSWLLLGAAVEVAWRLL